MNKVLVSFNGNSQIYDVYPWETAQGIAASMGVTDPSLFQEFSDSDFEAACYYYPSSFFLSSGVVGFSLADAKQTAELTEKQKYTTKMLSTLDGYTPEAIGAQAALPSVIRIPEIDAIITNVNTLSTELQANLAAIAAATTINEVNNIVNPPYGTLFTGRGSGSGAQDLNPSYFSSFTSVSLSESDMELYIPGTSTVIPYNPTSPPYTFDSAGNCFNVGDYEMQIRVSATSEVIATITVPLNPTGENVTF